MGNGPLHCCCWGEAGSSVSRASDFWVQRSWVRIRQGQNLFCPFLWCPRLWNHLRADLLNEQAYALWWFLEENAFWQGAKLNDSARFPKSHAFARSEMHSGCYYWIVSLRSVLFRTTSVQLRRVLLLHVLFFTQKCWTWPIQPERQQNLAVPLSPRSLGSAQNFGAGIWLEITENKTTAFNILTEVSV